MRRLFLFIIVASFATFLTPSFAGSGMSGKWKAKKSGGNLMLRVSGGKTQMKISGSCNNGWITTDPSDAFVLEGGNLVLKIPSFNVPIGGECTTAKVKAKASGSGFRFSFRNKWSFSGSVN